MMTRIYTILSVFCLLTSFAFADPAGDLRGQGIETQADGGQITILTGKDLKVVDNLLTSGTATITGAVYARGAATIAGATALQGLVTLTNAMISTPTAKTVNAPTTAVTVTNVNHLRLTANSARTGWALTGAALNQEVLLEGTSDSNTITLNDGSSSMTLAADLVLGAKDNVRLKCTSSDGDEWTQIGPLVNN